MAQASKIKDEITVQHNQAMKKQKDEAELAFQTERVAYQRQIERLYFLKQSHDLINFHSTDLNCFAQMFQNIYSNA